MAELKSKKMKTKHGGMFIALKYGAAAMAAATAYHLYMKQNGGPNKGLTALDDAAMKQRRLDAMKQRAMDAYHRSLRMPKL